MGQEWRLVTVYFLALLAIFGARAWSSSDTPAPVEIPSGPFRRVAHPAIAAEAPPCHCTNE